MIPYPIDSSGGIGVNRNIAANKTHFCAFRSSAGLDALGIDGRNTTTRLQDRAHQARTGDRPAAQVPLRQDTDSVVATVQAGQAVVIPNRSGQHLPDRGQPDAFRLRRH